MIRFRKRESDFSVLQRAKTDPGPTQFPIEWAPVVLSPGVKQLGRDVNYSPLSSADVKNDRNYASSSPFALMA